MILRSVLHHRKQDLTLIGCVELLELYTNTHTPRPISWSAGFMWWAQEWRHSGLSPLTSWICRQRHVALLQLSARKSSKCVCVCKRNGMCWEAGSLVKVLGRWASENTSRQVIAERWEEQREGETSEETNEWVFSLVIAKATNSGHQTSNHARPQRSKPTKLNSLSLTNNKKSNRILQKHIWWNPLKSN